MLYSTSLPKRESFVKIERRVVINILYSHTHTEELHM